MRNYFVYLPQQPPGAIWGCTATSVGFARVGPRAKYPPTKHPADHHFEWARGRVLQSYQILFISEGAGLFESGSPATHRSSNLGQCSYCFPVCGIATPPILLWAGRNTGSSVKARLLMRHSARELCSLHSPYCTQAWSRTCCVALSAATRSRLGAHWRTSISYRRWVLIFSR